MAVLAGYTYFGAVAQDVPGNSNYGHSHKKAKKAKKHYTVSNTSTQRKAANVQHRTTIKTVTSNDALTNQQQKDQIKQANIAHKTQIKSVSKGKK